MLLKLTPQRPTARAIRRHTAPANWPMQPCIAFPRSVTLKCTTSCQGLSATAASCQNKLNSLTQPTLLYTPSLPTPPAPPATAAASTPATGTTPAAPAPAPAACSAAPPSRLASCCCWGLELQGDAVLPHAGCQLLRGQPIILGILTRTRLGGNAATAWAAGFLS
jgi:hypothetical protein